MIKSLFIGLIMSLNLAKTRIISYGILICLLSSCFHPPYNNFKRDHRTARTAAGGTVAGATVGVMASSTLTGTIAGGVVGGVIGTAIGLKKESKQGLIKELQKQDIQFVEYGDTMTLIVPTDKYYMFNSPRFNEVCYPGMINIIKLLSLYPKSPIYVAGFTDNVGSSRHKKLLSQAQAETMLTYLWANNIRAYRLKAEGYGDKNDISDNKLIHGSAQNRRVEIQWFTGLIAQPQQPILMTK